MPIRTGTKAGVDNYPAPVPPLSDDTRDAALRWLTRTGNDQPEVLGALGLLNEAVNRRAD